MIPLRVHNVLDYVAGVVLVVAPFVFGFSDIPAARGLFLVLGLGLIAYSLLTRYYYSIAKIIPLRAHMTMDVIAGVCMILGPSVLGYRQFLTGGQFFAHIVLGAAPILLVAMTYPRTYAPGITGSMDRTNRDRMEPPSIGRAA